MSQDEPMQTIQTQKMGPKYPLDPNTRLFTFHMIQDLEQNLQSLETDEQGPGNPPSIVEAIYNVNIWWSTKFQGQEL